MKTYKKEWVGFTKNNELVVFDSDVEGRKEMKFNSDNYSQIFAGVGYMVADVQSLEKRKDEFREELQRMIDELGM